MGGETDSKGNRYFEVGNIRITCIPETWNGQPGIRIQAKKAAGGLHMGAELPIPDRETAYGMLDAIHKALDANGV